VTTAICITLLVYDTLNGLGLGIVAWEYCVLMDNKKNRRYCWAIFFMFLTISDVNSIISNLLNSDSKQIDL
jgi:hypothetical protein